MQNRMEYQGKMEAQLSALGAEIDKFRTMVGTTTADTKQGYHDHIESLRAKQALIHAKLQELKTASDDAWGDLKEGLDQSWDQVRDVFDKAAARFK